MGDLVPRGGGQLVPTAEMVKENVRSVLSKIPDLISFDATTDEGEMLALRCQVDPGIPAQQRDGWIGVVTGWYVGTYQVTDEKTGEEVTLPSLCLTTDDGKLCRLTGWPAIKSWATILQAAGAERCALGIRVRVSRRQSGTAGRSYWQVMPDA